LGKLQARFINGQKNYEHEKSPQLRFTKCIFPCRPTHNLLRYNLCRLSRQQFLPSSQNKSFVLTPTFYLDTNQRTNFFPEENSLHHDHAFFHHEILRHNKHQLATSFHLDQAILHVSNLQSRLIHLSR